MSASHPQLAVVPESAVELTPIRVLIADDHPLIIAGVRRTIEHFDKSPQCETPTTNAAEGKITERRYNRSHLPR